MNSIVILALFYAFMTLFGIASLYLFLGKVRTSIPRTKNENFSHLISMGNQ